MHNYLDKIGQHPNFNKFSIEPKHWVQHAKYGFDEREVWDLDYAFYCWLYERLKMFLSIHEGDYKERKFYFNGEKYSKEELAKEIIDRLEYYFRYKDLLPQIHSDEYVKEVGKLWAILLPSLWW